MIHAATRFRGLPTALIVGAYAAAVLTLTWLTREGFLGDAAYGVMAMVIMALPLSLVGTSLYGTLEGAVTGQGPDYAAPGWQYVLMAWPGLVTAVILGLLLTWRRTRPAATAAGWALAGLVILMGAATTFDSWAPRRPYGWPFLIYGSIMVVALRATRPRPRRRD
ncbi:hypothetical protein [Nonomuraea pusilla]|uniref:Uncharacterized protein n=1 Tax=Nonomuraea pusilla TaxID=46177 RepID=A0A1H8EUB9_9ACTN|nr:hypothetical protein [Nonomuraea pusilla]SEN23082.1 hypothetical protein SAMN05660976_07110 [Nonomuraea pusilla]